jgi:multicomponent Na+:H+ antiporter subunit E
VARPAQAAGLVAAWPAVLCRFCLYALFWLLLAGFDPADLSGFAVAVAGATWASLILLPPGRWRTAPLGLAWLVLRFPAQSVLAGVDVAWRAMQPELKLRPGFVAFQCQLPPGTAREAFCTLASLLPGTLPSGIDANGALRVHCLDIGQPVAATLAAEERLFLRALRMPDHA